MVIRNKFSKLLYKQEMETKSYHIDKLPEENDRTKALSITLKPSLSDLQSRVGGHINFRLSSGAIYEKQRLQKPCIKWMSTKINSSSSTQVSDSNQIMITRERRSKVECQKMKKHVPRNAVQAVSQTV